MTLDRRPVFSAVRDMIREAANDPRWDWSQDAIATLDRALDTAAGVPAPLAEPLWLATARKMLGQREIVGPKHNGWISAGWARLGASWFNDDETPWCGFFVADCVDKAGLSFPAKGEFARALAWRTWGIGVEPRVGAVVVFQRPGGGHVGFLVGEDATNFYVLGGNQGNAVSIAPIAKTRAVAVRWPAGRPLTKPGLPRMSGGVTSTNER